MPHISYADDATAAKSIVNGDKLPSIIEHGIIWSGEIAQRAGVTLVEMNIGGVATPNWAISRASGFNAVTTLSLEGESITCDNSGSGDTDGCYRPDGVPDCPIRQCSIVTALVSVSNVFTLIQRKVAKPSVKSTTSQPQASVSRTKTAVNKRPSPTSLRVHAC